MNLLKAIFEFLFTIGILINTVVYIPQAIKLVCLKHAREISLLTFSSFNIFLFVQLIYAFIHRDFHFLWGSALILSSSLIVTALILYYRLKTKEINRCWLKCVMLSIVALITVSALLLQVDLIQQFFITYVINIIYAAAFLWTAVSAIPQIMTLLRLKDSSELSVITFLGFNFIQVVTIIHACFYQEWLLLAGVSLFLIIYAYLSSLVIYYRVKK